MHNAVTSMEIWLAEVRKSFVDVEPELLALFNIYAGEAVFGRRYIEQDLISIGPHARVLEVGAGSLLLSCQLIREGFDVTALEPTGSGFSHFEKMRQLVLEKAAELDCVPRLLHQPAETLAAENNFDFAFSINVMEHVDDVERVIINVANSLKVNATYRFTCPNYLFPYEPHFNIPTLFSKRLTERVLKRRIFDIEKMADPIGTWASLNWITTSQVRNVGKRISNIRITFNSNLLVSTLERISYDRDFAGRRSPLICRTIMMLVQLRLHKLLRFVPVELHPIIDCKLRKEFESETLQWPR